MIWFFLVFFGFSIEEIRGLHTYMKSNDILKREIRNKVIK